MSRRVGISKIMKNKPEKENIWIAEIIEMAEKDQEMRRRGVETGERDEGLDRSNTERMKAIIEQVGWPTISKAGAAASHKAWLLVQHSPDVEFQKRCLKMMKQEQDGEVNKKDIAYLEDRILILEGKPQIYGTQFKKEGNEYIVYPIENPERIDELRKELGMESLEKYRQGFYRMKKSMQDKK